MCVCVSGGGFGLANTAATKAAADNDNQILSSSGEESHIFSMLSHKTDRSTLLGDNP